MGMLRKSIPQTTPTERRQRREARSTDRRAQALALRQAGATYAAIGDTLVVSLERARQIVQKAERLVDHPRWTDALPARAVNFLVRHCLDALPEIEAAQAVARLSRRKLMSNSNFGRGACEALCGWLAAHELTLRESLTNETSAPLGRPLDSDNGGPLRASRKNMDQRLCLPRAKI